MKNNLKFLLLKNIALNDTVLAEFDIFIFDVEQTIIDAFNQKGEIIYLFQMIPPFYLLDANTIKDVNNNICILHNGLVDFLKILKENDKQIGIISKSKDPNKVDNAQSVLMILQKFNIYDYFNFIYLLNQNQLKYKFIPESNENNILFFDNDIDEIFDIKQHRPDVSCILRQTFEDYSLSNFKKSSREESWYDFETYDNMDSNKIIEEIYKKYILENNDEDDDDGYKDISVL